MNSESDQTNKIDRGLEQLERMAGKRYRDEYDARIKAGGFGSALTRMAVEFAFSDAWARPGLELRDRSLVMIALMIAMRQTTELKSHFHLGINNGLTATELEEVLVQCVPYIGLAPIHLAREALREVLVERGLFKETSAQLI